jgi:hypothetical protein
MITSKKPFPALSPLASLRRFAAPREATESCALCSAELSEEHNHLFELANRRLSCACEPCAVLFSNAAAPRYRRVPRDVRRLVDFRMDDVQWEAFGLPINLAFFVKSEAVEKIIAYYPSPGGAIEALPPAEAWDELAAENEVLKNIQPDVEAFLVNRLGTEANYYLLGVDHGYALAGLVRAHWRGFSGGSTVWAEIANFFARLQARSLAGGATRHV